MCGGAEDVELIAYAWLMGHLFLPFGIHTWRSNSEVLNFLTAVGKHHDIHIKYMFPCAAEEQQTMLRNKGPFCFYKNEHPQFCQVRKVRPLNRDPRVDIPFVQVDLSFEGTDDGEVGTGLMKLSSLAKIDTQEICNSPLAMNAALKSVHSQVQRSFKCESCTRLVFPMQREDGIGCWCWEEARSENRVLHRGGIKLYVHIDGTESTTTTKGTGIEDLLYPKCLSEAWLVSPFGCQLFQVIEGSIIR